MMTLNGHNGSVECLKFAHLDNFVYSADEIGIIKQWDMDSDSHSTYHGHMKSVRTMDMHPTKAYFVSGSNDTTIRLWDMKRSKESVAKYRAHIATVNQVQFSPDGNWIASAGAEGTVLIWEVRETQPIMEFQDSKSTVGCIQFHPSEYLLAAGRSNGTVDIFDLDKKKLFRRIELSTGTVKSVLFSDHGKWLFVGTDSGVTVVAWETDQPVDFIESSWTSLFSMKLLNNKLMCGTLDGAQVQVYDFNVELVGKVPTVPVVPAYQQRLQSNGGGGGGVSLSSLNIRNAGGGGTNDGPFMYPQSNEVVVVGKDRFRMTSGSVATDEDSGSPSSNLSIEMMSEDVDETLTQNRINQAMADDEGGDSDTIEFAYPDNRIVGLRGGGGGNNNYDSWQTDDAQNSLSVASSSSPSYEDNVAPDFRLSVVNRNVEVQRGHLEYQHGVNSPTRKAQERFDRHTDDFLSNCSFYNGANSDPGYKSDSGGDCLHHRDGASAEDFPVNNAAPPNYAPKSVTATSSAVTTGRMSRQRTSIGFSAATGSGKATQVVQPQMSSRLSAGKRMGSLSVTNLADLGNGDNANKFKTKNGGVMRGTQNPKYRAGGSPVRSKYNVNKENQAVKNNNNNNAKNGNFKVEFFGKPPTRSRSSFDMRSAGVAAPTPRGGPQGGGNIPVRQNRMSRASMNFEEQPQYSVGGGGGGYGESNVNGDINHIASGHQRVFQELCNRHATLKMNKDVAMQDILMAIRQIARVDPGGLVDVLGAVLEKSNAMTLDMAIVVLPELYKLLQSDKKFHCTRACDTLRVILTNFLPLIKENSSSWAAHSLGVDISSEERWRKCGEARKWLLMIRTIPDNRHSSNALSQLQNLIVDL